MSENRESYSLRNFLTIRYTPKSHTELDPVLPGSLKGNVDSGAAKISERGF